MDAKGRKPLILRGARQVGKTVAVKLFARHFDPLSSI
jgi:predicted AAA+ superfamily ATPase